MKDVEKRVKLIVWTAETVGGRKKSSDGYGAQTKLPLKPLFSLIAAFGFEPIPSKRNITVLRLMYVV